MITISERKTEKVVGETSLFVSFDYRKEHVNFIHTLDGCNFSRRTRLWEIPSIYLSQVLDYFCQFDDIELNLLQDEPEIISEPVEIDVDSYKLRPFDYQVDAIKYGLNHMKWLLLDPPGLGKTAVIIHIIEELVKRENLEHCLVICGINTLKENWRKEVKKHSDLSAMILGQRLKKDGTYTIDGVAQRKKQLLEKIEETVVITNIETIRDNEIVELIENGPNKFDLVVCDEVHTMKNPNSQQGSNFLSLKKHKRKIAATGTLLVNSPLDSYVPLNWIDVERATLTNFKYFYCNFNGSILTGYKNTSLLKDMISKYSLRRSKDILNLPPVSFVEEFLDMDPKQQKFYDEVKTGIREQVDKVVLRRSNILSIVGRLRQATACPSVLTTHDIPSAKIDRCCDLVEQITSSGDKVLIFSTFKETVYQLKERLKDFNPLVGTGDEPDEVISKNNDLFQTDDKHKCFIATWQKCGTGLTLTAASYVIFIDTPWTYSSFSQAFERAYRIGTTKPVTVYTLMAKGTFDEKVNQIVNAKGVVSDYMIDDEVDDNTLDILKKYILDL